MARLPTVGADNGNWGTVLNFGTSYLETWTPNTAANNINTITFVYNGTNWIQISAETGIT